MRQPSACPICEKHTFRQLYRHVRINADLDDEFRNVGGLAAFACSEHGHVFFVLKKDLTDQDDTAATNGTYGG
jgi:hypothetical protein